MLVDMFHWSLYDIDRTDIESLIPFVFRYSQKKIDPVGRDGGARTLYADQVQW